MEGHEKIMRKLRDMRKPVKRVAKIGKLYENYIMTSLDKFRQVQVSLDKFRQIQASLVAKN